MQVKRIQLWDTVRGFALISMIAYHFVYDCVMLSFIDGAWFQSFWAYLWQQSICWCFVLLAGYVHGYNKHAYKSGFTILLCAAVVSAVSVFALPGEEVWFGILHLIGTATLVTALLRKLFMRIPAWVGAAGSFLLFCITKSLYRNVLFLGVTVTVPRVSSPLLYVLGYPQHSIRSADYFPLMPWLFLFWTGWFLFRQFSARLTAQSSTMRINVPVVSWLGRHSLAVYMLHQPILMGVLLLWQYSSK